MNMPTYEVFIDGKPRKIELAKTGEKSFTAKIDDKHLNAELEAGTIGFEKQFSIKIDGKTYKVHLPKTNYKEAFQAKIEEATFKAEVKTPTASRAATTSFEPAFSVPAKKATQKSQVVEGAVTAPMTGKIVSIKVKKGEQVKQGQPLCVIEAMKMENEIAAPKTGIVQEVDVAEGSSVSEGETLFVIA